MSENINTLIHRLQDHIQTARPLNDSLLSGRLGLALYYFTRWQAFDTVEDAEKAQDLLAEVYEHLEKESAQIHAHAFAGGAAGLGWIVNLFYRHDLVDIDPAEDLAGLDQFLFSAALEQIDTDGRLDYLHGAMGILHYFNSRLPDPVISTYLTRLIQALTQKAVREEQGLWFHNWVLDKEKETADINLSLSHGLSGFLLILCNTWEAGLQLPEIKDLVTEGVNFILAHQQPVNIETNEWSFFPSTIKVANRNESYRSNRLAWCYGDFGPVLLLHKAGTLFTNSDWIKQSSTLGTFTLMRKTAEATLSTETLLCHGSAGMARFYQTLHEVTGIDRYAEGQTFWINKTLELLPAELEKQHYKDKEGELLEGMAGVNMALLSYLSEKPLSWPQALLM